MTANLFYISYRRIDGPELRSFVRVRYRLEQTFGDGSVYNNDRTHSHELGEAVRQCKIVLLLIGPDWRPDNWVKPELEIAQANRMRVIPILVEKGVMPPESVIPPGLRWIASIDAQRVRPGRKFRDDMAKLTHTLVRALSERIAQEVLDGIDVEPRLGLLDDAPAVARKAIFISHSTHDGSQFARAIAFALEAKGRKCWIAPRDIKPAVAYPGQIVRAIEDCEGLVVVITPKANESHDVLQEVQIAHSARKLIAPVIVGNVIPQDDLRYYFGVRQNVSWTTAEAVADLVLQSL